jgi:hypothetical protein
VCTILVEKTPGEFVVEQWDEYWVLCGDRGGVGGYTDLTRTPAPTRTIGG